VPDIWIGDAATNAAVVRGHEAEVFRKVRAFASTMWAQRWDLDVIERPKEGWKCGRTYCRADAGRMPVALWWGRAVPDEKVMAAMCASAEVVAVRSEVTSLPHECADALVLDGRDFATKGAVELWRTQSGWKARWVRDVRGERPWSRWGDPDYQ